MIRIGKKEKSDKLYQAILQLKDPQECYDFFQDLCTVSELRSMEQRFEVASLLNARYDLQRHSGARPGCVLRYHQPGEPVFELTVPGAYERVFARLKAEKAEEEAK